MKTRVTIWLSILALTGMAALYSVRNHLTSAESMMMIQVYAGADRSICPGNSLDLYDLSAYITGEVDNGYWFTSGDGRFLPGNTQNIRFSSGLTYVPGIQDVNNGGFTLTLVSDDPDLDPITGTNGPKVQVSDQVFIQFLPPPVLVCNSNLQVSLNFDCTVQLDASALVANPRPPYEDYTVEMYDKNNQKIQDNILTKNHLKQNITFQVGHACTSTYCWGNLQVSDYYPPIFVCRNDTISCLDQADPMSLGLPIPPGATVDSIRNGKYYIKNWDACGQVQMTFTEEMDKKDCSFPIYDKIITRTWSAKDESQNLATCQQKIYLRKAALAEITFPPSFDDVQMPSFDCLDTFPTFPNGHPSTDTTGIPTGSNCQNIGTVMTDIRFETCGSSFKIVRSWFVIEWCSQESVTRNQIILVKDKRAPIFECPGDITLGTGYYTCATASEILPLPDSAIDCSNFSWLIQIKDSLGQNFNSHLFYSNQEYRVENLPIGKYIVEYTALDECSHAARCSINLTVKDVAPPIPVCDKNTKISVDHLGNARLFATSLDDGSWDNCGILKYEIKRKTDSCGHAIVWGPFADFCCKDVGTLQHVSMQVTDIHGLVNTCHVEVEVEDKLPPVITCPSNITILCDYGYDPDNLDEFGTVALAEIARKNIVILGQVLGRDGLTTDNCTVTVSHDSLIDVQCFKGNIYRTFTATDKGGRQASCTQTIGLYNPDPFDENDITWPNNYIGDGCKVADVDTSVSGAPRYRNTGCSSVASWYEDQPFFIADSACVKIFRNWYVIDWCQFNESTLTGRWGPYTQIIKISNHEAPTLLQGCRDTVICHLEENCGPAQVLLFAAGEDDCTPVNQLTYEYQIDIENNGAYDVQGSTAQFQGLIPLGNHKIRWILRDQCGNTTDCTSFFEIRDCKKPTPYCISQVSMDLDEVSHEAELWAIDLDLGSYDNCTPQEKLVFSFSTDTSDQVRFLDCADIPNGQEGFVPLDMYVTDEYGNQHFCSVSVFLTDHNDVCPDQITHGDISGKIALTTGFPMENVPVTFRQTDKTEFGSVLTNPQGEFIIPELSNESSFVLRPTLNTELTKGLSTLDIVLIQRHIIGTKPFENPYQFIAADVNRSKSINSVDLVELRKVILGTRTVFPNNTPSWVFVDHAETFPFGPFGQPLADSIVSDVPSVNQDFTAVKMGDINQSYENDLTGHGAESRNHVYRFIGEMEKTSTGNVIRVSNENSMMLDGFEWVVELPRKDYNKNIVIKENVNNPDLHFDYAIIQDASNQDIVKVIAYADAPVWVERGSTLFTLEMPSCQPKDEVDLQYFYGEWYENEKPVKLGFSLSSANHLSSEPNELHLLANPVKDVIRFKYSIRPEPGENFVCKLFDSNGQWIAQEELACGVLEEGYQEISIPPAATSGLYMITLWSDNTLLYSKKVIKID